MKKAANILRQTNLAAYIFYSIGSKHDLFLAFQKKNDAGTLLSAKDLERK